MKKNHRKNASPYLANRICYEPWPDAVRDEVNFAFRIPGNLQLFHFHFTEILHWCVLEIIFKIIFSFSRNARWQNHQLDKNFSERGKGKHYNFLFALYGVSLQQVIYKSSAVNLQSGPEIPV